MDHPAALDPRTTVEQRQLIEQHLPLVGWVVGEVAPRIPRYVPSEDLESAGRFGLFQAALAFDASRGVPFAAFARMRIRGAVLDELRSRDWAGRTVRNQVKQVRSAVDELRVTLGREPSREEIAARAEIDADELHRAVGDGHRSSVLLYDSVFLAASESDALAVADADPGEELLHKELRGYLRDAVGALPERLRRVVIGYFFEERPMADLAAELDVTDSRISQMRAEAVALLRDGMNSQLEPSLVRSEANPGHPAAKRRAAYYAAVASGSDLRSRLASDAPAADQTATTVA